MKLLRRPGLLASVVIAAVAVSGLGASAQASTVPAGVPAALPAQAAEWESHDRTVSDVPADWTPGIEDGTVYSIAQVGDSMVVGGDFTTVTPSSGSPAMSRPNVFAFDAGNGQINSNFAPVPDGEVRAVEPGPTPGTVYVGGAFKGIDGQGGKIHLLNVSDGSIVSSFSAPGMNGAVQDMVLIGDRLYVAGVFTKVGGQPFGGLVALDAATGQRQDFLSVSLTENHNYTGQPGQARAPVGAKAFAVDAAGTQMSVIGNFKKADGLDRDQMVMIDLTGATAAVRTDWRTLGYEATCASRAFDTYMRDIDFAPDGSYVAVATTGGPFSGTLCDTVTRWDVANSGQDVEPDWIDESGGDTFLSVATSGAAVYTGGHQRWMNNPNGRDSAGAGAVPRAGLGGMDPENGVPVSWNPGRHPRGVGAEAISVTETGLWVGSDTEFIGHFRYRRPRLAFFPVEGGIQQGPGETGDLPSNVYLVNNKSAESNVLFRVNAAGPELPVFDGGPSWAADNFDDSSFRNSGSRTATSPPVPTVGDGVPSGTPSALFESERWDPSGGEEMSWDIPVADGEDVSVRLYLANRCGCTDDPGERVFDVDLEGATVLSDYDIVADVGHDTGTVKEFDVTSDGNIDIDFRHIVENPLINGIEIVSATPEGEPMPDGPGLSRLYYGGGAATGEPQAAPSGDIPWADVRGAVLIDGELFYGTRDREFFRRSFDGEAFGEAEAIDPYNDPEWADVETGSGTSVYGGVQPSFYNEIPGVVGMSYQDDRLYYTRSGSSALFSRAFVPESGVLSEKVTQVSGFDAANTAGIFFDSDGDTLYYANSSNGTLSRISWDDGAVTGGATVVSGPDIDGVDWRTRVLFLGPGPEPVVNQTPIADIADPSCEGLVCGFDGSGSSDPDDGDSVASYSWDFGDGQTDTGATPSHEFAAEGSYDVMLTVADQDGAEGSTTVTVDVQAAPENQAPEAVIAEPSCDGLTCGFDGSGSSDPEDGDSVASYSWDFGDGQTDTGATPSHEFAAEGSYDVMLTVADQDGAEGSTTVTVDVVEDVVVADDAPELVGQDAINGRSKTPHVVVPEAVQEGDLLLLLVSSQSPEVLDDPTGVSDWTKEKRVTSGSLATTVFSHIADGSEAGKEVGLTFDRYRKTDLTLLVYRGVGDDPIEAIEATSFQNEIDHTTPGVQLAEDGRTVLSYWADRSSSTTEWTAPSEVNVLSTQIGKGGGRVTTLVAQATPEAGAYGELTAQTDQVSGRSVAMTVVLAP